MNQKKSLKELNLLDKFLFDNRQIRLDVYAIDEDDVIYEVETQKENTHNLPKRSRLYQGIIDSKLLPPGVVDFNLLNEVLSWCHQN